MLAVEIEERLHLFIVQVIVVDVERGHHLALLGIGEYGLDGLSGHAECVLRHDAPEERVALNQLVEELAIGIEGIYILVFGLEQVEDIHEVVAVEEHEVVVVVVFQHGLHLTLALVTDFKDGGIGLQGLESFGALHAGTVGHGEGSHLVAIYHLDHILAGSGVVGADVGVSGQRTRGADR